ncbi:acyltransferase family protein [Saccharibacillus sp. CPCC 101409]|uniref:acyltransferase family protein n=1 Tax=Saccharibacillus sp. CPCC 101409 TaxID=3058041 RepID=UPI0026736234|nr:acyltransferase family protein [Saccharibacillus sp. CPCC 101409]MDO3410056.1 acyltransferase family protein [Saccharibacillus sp. CPCC 101409]
MINGQHAGNEAKSENRRYGSDSRASGGRTSAAERPKHNAGRYMPGLDGLRALAVLAVIFYHLHTEWAPGGLLGVTMFFVLSGYLITDILMAQWDRMGRFDMKDFWVRRAKRLLPAMLAVVLATVLWSIVVDRSRLPAMLGDVPAALLYYSNWWLIFHEVSYFQSFGPLSPLGHLWSLAVEEQFYIFWPVLLGIGLILANKRRARLALVLAGLSLASALAMGIMYHPGEDPSRVYYGTDTRLFSLLIGAALAVVWPSRKLKTNISKSATKTLDITATICLIVIAVLIFKSNDYGTFLYRGGMVLLSLATTILVAALAHPACRLGRVLGAKPLRWIGARSYGLYLWHYPVIVLTTPLVNTGGPNITRILLQLLVSFALAALSYRYIEQPVRTGEFGKWWRRVMRAPGAGRKRLASTLGGTAAGILLLGVLMNVLAPAPEEQTPYAGTEAAAAEPQPGAAAGTPESGAQAAGAEASAGTGEAAALPAGAGIGITAIGDSVMLDIEPYLAAELPGITVDGLVGRQMSQAPALITELESRNRIGSTVVIELGTNGSFTDEQLDTLLAELTDVRKIVLMNTRVPRPWEQVVNAALERAAQRDERITLVDWYSASAGRDDYFAKDGVHLMPAGARAYTELLVDALRGA